MPQTPPPNLFQSSIPWHGIGSKDWAPRNTVQRVGGIIVGIAYVLGALTLIASSFWFRVELTSELRSETAGIFIGFVLTAMALAAGAGLLWLGIRILRGAARPLRPYDPLVGVKSPL